MSIRIAIQSTRVPFLILAPVCVFLGSSLVIADNSEINLFTLSLALLGALLAHIGVNSLNEYRDFRSGLDMITVKTPFSGGSGTLPENPELASTVLGISIVSIIALFTIGIFFTLEYGAGIIPIGITGILLIITYTDWINKHPYLCLLAPGLGFGFLMVVGTQYVLQGEYITLSWLIAAVPFLLVNNLLLLNQYPDTEADASVGRNHFPIRYGIRRSNMVYGLFASATAIIIIAYVLLEKLPATALIALLPMPLAFYALSGAVKYGTGIGNHPAYMKANVAVTILTPLLLAISISMA